MPNWLEKYIAKVLDRYGIWEGDVVEVWFSRRNPKRVVLTWAPEGHPVTAKRLSIPIPQGRR